MTFVEETPSELFAQLTSAAHDATNDITRAYRTIAAVFRRAIDQRLRLCPVAFAGTFSKVDYLLRECHVTAAVAQQVNDTRQRLRHIDTTAPEEQQRLFAYDLKNVARFIAAINPGCTVPPSLAALLPTTDRKVGPPPPMGECLRAVVTKVDGALVLADAANGRHLVIDCEGAWQGVTALVSAGSQLNLVRPRMTDGRVTAEAVIVEPDYLVDISSVAACFESHGASPYTFLLNQLRPAPLTPTTLLGNFAGQLLDEAVHGSRHTYAESVGEFFRTNALSVASCPGLDADFHKQARLQMANIRRAVETLQNKNADNGDSETTLLEPSFFCESLGLQGRMDLLRIDPCRPSHCLLVEQKSGKGGFPPLPDPETPRHRESHYVQLLLYMAVLHYGHGLANAAIDTYLLYSRYANSLLKVGSAPELLRQAIMLRNEIVALQMRLADGDTDILCRLTPEDINIRHANGRLWQCYTRPAIEATLRPMREASPAECAYFSRFVAFVAREHLLAKMGNKTKECSGFASKWHDTLSEKLAAGNIVCGMEVEAVLPCDAEQPAVGGVRMALGNASDAEGANFRPGDAVIVYSYAVGREPDARRAAILRATVETLTTATATLRLRRPQASADVFRRPPGHAWAMEHDLFESSATSLLRGLHAFLRAPKPRRDLILAARKPVVDSGETLRGDYGAFNQLVLRAMQARDLFLVIGPPGTGKTSFAMLNILREELLREGTAVLLAAYTNRAVDEMCSKLIEADIDFVRMGTPSACAAYLRSHLLERRAAQCPTADGVRRLVESVRVVCATTASLAANTVLLSMKRFSLAVVDEASQILEPHIMPLLAATTGGDVSVERLVLIGDHKQLPAVTQQTEAEAAVADPLLRAVGIEDCRQSFFERMLRTHHADPAFSFMLTQQGRMHRDIAAFPSETFYGSRLRVVPLPHQESLLPPAHAGTWAERAMRERRVSFVATASPSDDMPDKVNAIEARAAATLAEEVWREAGTAFDPDVTLGIIVPYRSQIAAIHTALAHTGIAQLEAISIDTVERFQGSQRDTIIYSFTIRKPYQLNFLTQSTFVEDGRIIDRKLNVAMTRAREHLVMVGNPALLSRNATFAALLNHVRQTGGYVEMDAGNGGT